MDDRELLEWAAKAAGMEYEGVSRGEDVWFDAVRGRMHGSWNPRTDDGDCARLEAACGIEVRWSEKLVLANSPSGASYVETFDDHNGDKNKARRYASTHAAAEIGRSMNRE